MKKTDKQMSESYIERDISWMYFNQRILLEAQKESVPLLERLTFLGIYSNNLDEFFRVRMATLNRIIEYEDKAIRRERDTAIETYKEISYAADIFLEVADNYNAHTILVPTIGGDGIIDSLYAQDIAIQDCAIME